MDAKHSGKESVEIIAASPWIIGLLGLLTIAIVRWMFGLTFEQITETWLGKISTAVFAGMFVLGFLVLQPLAILAGAWKRYKLKTNLSKQQKGVGCTVGQQ